MDRFTIASGLLRDLWRIYDHGGHSMRSAHSQLLETDWPYSLALLRKTSQSSFFNYFEHPAKLPTLPNLRHALNAPAGLRWEWRRKGNRLLMLAGLAREYATFKDHGYVEHRILMRAIEYAGLPLDGGIYATAIDGIDTYELTMILRNEDPEHRRIREEILGYQNT